MKAIVRQLNIDDVKFLEDIDDYRSKILLEELQSSNEENIDYISYGIFSESNELIGFCGLSHSEEYDSYKFWDSNSRAISELYMKDEYNNDLSLYCDLLNFILYDKQNKNYNIFFDNIINLNFDYFDQLGFVQLDDGVLVRLVDDSIFYDSI